MTERSWFRAKLSNDDLLCIVSQLGVDATEMSIWRSLNARFGKQVSLAWLRKRLFDLNTVGLAIYLPSLDRALGSSGSDTKVRLTALGVERLEALQREHMGPPIE